MSSLLERVLLDARNCRPPDDLCIAIPSQPEAVRAARAAISGWAWGLALGWQRMDTLRLLVSEVVTNAVLRSTPDAPIRVWASCAGRQVRVAVTDANPDPSPRLPSPRGEAETDGLKLLAGEAAGWGIEERNAGTCVWFEL